MKTYKTRFSRPKKKVVKNISDRELAIKFAKAEKQCQQLLMTINDLLGYHIGFNLGRAFLYDGLNSITNVARDMQSQKKFYRELTKKK